MSDVISKGLNRLAYQFSNSTKFKGFLNSFLEEYQAINTVNLQLLNERYLDLAIGVQLDGIGEIVGVERPLQISGAAGAFGFLGDDTARGFSDLFNTELGGAFIDFYKSAQPISDDLYRVIIRAKIITNQTAMTVDDTTRLISFMFGGVSVEYSLPINLHPEYTIYKKIEQYEYFLFPYIPKIIGISDVKYYMSDNGNVTPIY